jgi:SAM-dependent methyltransferase
MYEKGKKIIKEANEFQKNSLRDGSSSLNKVYNQIRKQETLQAIAKNQIGRNVSVKKYITTGNVNRVKLINGDLENKQHSFAYDSVDLIFTNSPMNYSEDLQIYRTLAKFASKVLRPGGNLVTFVPNRSLPQVFKNMSVPNLKFWWPLVIIEEDDGIPIAHECYHVNSCWKPCLWYVKNDGPERLHPISDLIEPSHFSELLNGKQKPLPQL